MIEANHLSTHNLRDIEPEKETKHLAKTLILPLGCHPLVLLICNKAQESPWLLSSLSGQGVLHHGQKLRLPSLDGHTFESSLPHP